MKHFIGATALAGLIAALPVASDTARADDSRTKVGVLTCSVDGGFGLVIGSSKAMNCTFEGGGSTSQYSGRISRFGLDIGKTRKAVIKWAVLAPTSQMSPGALAGSYGGLSGEITVGAGVGANALIGGSKNTIVLQPLSVQAQVGLDIAAGIAGMRLTAL